MSTRRRSIRMVAALTAAATLGLVGVAARPAAAIGTEREVIFFASPTSSKVVAYVRGRQQAQLTAFPTQQVMAGHFTSLTAAQAFLYNPGAGPDALVTMADDGTDLSLSMAPMPVAGTFRPFVYDFDANGYDDIFWYAPGTATDYLWSFQAGGTHTSTTETVNGSYEPLPFTINGSHNEPTAAAIVWYGAGTKPDALWKFDLGAGRHRDVPLRINGTYRPVVGTYYRKNTLYTSVQQILWYDPAGGPSTIWNFELAGTRHSSDPIASPGAGFQPMAGPYPAWADTNLDVLYWYRPGPGSEKLTTWTYTDDGPAAATGDAGPINATYRTLLQPGRRHPALGVVLLGPATPKWVQLDPEGSPPLFVITPFSGLPPNPVGGFTTFLDEHG